MLASWGLSGETQQPRHTPHADIFLRVTPGSEPQDERTNRSEQTLQAGSDGELRGIPVAGQSMCKCQRRRMAGYQKLWTQTEHIFHGKSWCESPEYPNIGSASILAVAGTFGKCARPLLQDEVRVHQNVRVDTDEARAVYEPRGGKGDIVGGGVNTQPSSVARSRTVKQEKRQ